MHFNIRLPRKTMRSLKGGDWSQTSLGPQHLAGNWHRIAAQKINKRKWEGKLFVICLLYIVKLFLNDS